MIVDLLLRRLQSSDANERACAVKPLFRALMCKNLDSIMRVKVSTHLTNVLKDPDPFPRLCLANALAMEKCVPHHYVMALAQDQLDIASPVILNSPVLRDYDLMYLILKNEASLCQIIASRPHLSTMVSSLLSRQGDSASCIILLHNPTACISGDALNTIAERYIENLEVHMALLAFPHLPILTRQRLMMTLCDALLNNCAVVDPCVIPHRMRCFIHETWERMTMEMMRTVSRGDCRLLIAQLQQNGKLSTSLLLRSLVYGDVFFFEESLAYLAGLPTHRARNLIKDYDELGFRSLYDSACLPPAAYRVFVFIVRNVLHMIENGEKLTIVSSRRRLLQHFLDSYIPQGSGDADTVLECLLRLYDEAVCNKSAMTFYDDVASMAAA